MWGSENKLLLSSLLILLFPLQCKSSSETETKNKTVEEHDFDYLKGSGKGPENWGEIDPKWKACDHEKMQSPIDLADNGVVVLPGLGRLKRKYKPGPAALKNKGHDIELRWKVGVGGIYINGTKYNLKQVHWHSPSEHTFNGSRYQLELHMVHKSNNGQVAVVGITYKYGRPDQFLAKLTPYIRAIGTDEIDVGIINPRDVKIGSRKYYRYMGSLTTPPCSEGVIWTIVKKVRTVSREQVGALWQAVRNDCKQNARPTQPLNGRRVWFYRPTVIPRSS